jgi:hypothetical protein
MVISIANSPVLKVTFIEVPLQSKENIIPL